MPIFISKDTNNQIIKNNELYVDSWHLPITAREKAKLALKDLSSVPGFITKIGFFKMEL